MTILDNETDTFVFQDEEFGINCDWNMCEHEAEWSGQSRCCGKVWLFCTLHLEINKSVGTPDGPPMILCAPCMTYHYACALTNIQSLKS